VINFQHHRQNKEFQNPKITDLLPYYKPFYSTGLQGDSLKAPQTKGVAELKKP
jgi:hypothetical protein